MDTLPEGQSRDADLVLVERARTGDREAVNALFTQHHSRLLRMVEMRLDARLRGRIEAADVVQEGFVDVVRRLDEYLKQPAIPLFLWLRLIVGERLAQLYRYHLGAQVRDASREVALYQGAMPEASTTELAAQLLGKKTSPSQAVMRAERVLRVQDALNKLDSKDREIISLRHFEQLTAAEAGQVIGITESAAARRYLRAMQRLKELLGRQEDSM
jgi:RNA polymerase sigma-70 factor, ECF subfamily